jgi:hypothetical protein
LHSESERFQRVRDPFFRGCENSKTFLRQEPNLRVLPDTHERVDPWQTLEMGKSSPPRMRPRTDDQESKVCFMNKSHLWMMMLANSPKPEDSSRAQCSMSVELCDSEHWIWNEIPTKHAHPWVLPRTLPLEIRACAPAYTGLIIRNTRWIPRIIQLSQSYLTTFPQSQTQTRQIFGPHIWNHASNQMEIETDFPGKYYYRGIMNALIRFREPSDIPSGHHSHQSWNN